VITRGVEFTIVFHCLQTMALLHVFISYIIPLNWVASHVAVRHHWLGLNHSAAVFLCQVSLHSSSLEAYTRLELIMRYRVKMGNRFLLMKDEVTNVLYICSATWPFLLANFWSHQEILIRRVRFYAWAAKTPRIHISPYHPFSPLKFGVLKWLQVMKYQQIFSQISRGSRRHPSSRLYFLESAVAWWIPWAWGASWERSLDRYRRNSND